MTALPVTELTSRARDIFRRVVEEFIESGQPVGSKTLAADGTLNLMGALKRALATTGYSDVKEFQRVEVVVSPYQPH